MKNLLKYSILTGIYAVLIVPFIVSSSMFFPYITGKGFAFRIIVEIIFGLWLILILKDSECRPKWSWVLGSALIFTFVLLLADIFAVAPFKAFWSNYERMEGFVTFAHLLAYFLIISSMLNKEKLWLWFLRANVIAGTIMAITSLDKATEARFSGPLGNPIYIAVYFLFIFFFSFLLLYKDVLVKNLSDWKLFKKVFANVLFYIYLAISVLSLYVVYRTSRGALLGALGGIFVGAVLISLFEKPARTTDIIQSGVEKKIIRQIALIGILLIFVVFLIFLGIRNTQYVKNNPTLSRLAEISWTNLNGQARQLVWPMAIKGFKEKPILGWGQEGFNYVFNKYYDPGMYDQESWFDRAHNAPLDFLVAGGLLGFLSYLALFASALYLLWFKKSNFDITEKSLLTGLLAGYLFQAIFVFDNLISYIFFFTALAYIHSSIVEKEEHKKVFNYFSDFISNQEYQNYILIPIIIFLTGFGVWWVNVPGIKANQTLIQALRFVQAKRISEGLESFESALSYKSMGDSEIREQLLSYVPGILKSVEIDNKDKQEFLTLTFDEMGKQIARVPEDARYYILMGSLLNNIGQSEKALPYIEKAVELSPKKQAMRFELIRSLYALNRKEEALIEAKSAYDLEPNYIQAKKIYEEVLKGDNTN